MLSGLAKLILGILAGITLLAAAGGATAYYFLTKLSVVPRKPIFAEEQPKSKPLLKGKNSAAKGKQRLASKSSSTPTSSETPSSAPETDSETGLYKGRISWREGVSLREEASRSSNRVGGIEYNKPVIVLEESEDKKWVLVREENGDQRGWVRAPNIERTNPDDAQNDNSDSEQQQ